MPTRNKELTNGLFKKTSVIYLIITAATLGEDKCN